MDIYEWAEENDYSADYFEWSTGLIYKVQEYGRLIKLKKPPIDKKYLRIRIVDSNTEETIGFAEPTKKSNK